MTKERKDFYCVINGKELMLESDHADNEVIKRFRFKILGNLINGSK